jgi:hypothetical protein
MNIISALGYYLVEENQSLSGFSLLLSYGKIFAFLLAMNMSNASS